MSEEIADLVDEQNRVIGSAPREKIRRENLLHRGVGILCRNSKGLIYVHRRTATKDVFPRMLDMWVGGMVQSGEDYAVSAKREIAEELGILGPEVRFLFNHLYQGPHNRAWVALYEVVWDGPIRHQPEEIEWGRYLSLEEICAKIDEGDWVPDGLEIFRVYLKR